MKLQKILCLLLAFFLIGSPSFADKEVFDDEAKAYVVQSSLVVSGELDPPSGDAASSLKDQAMYKFTIMAILKGTVNSNVIQLPVPKQGGQIARGRYILCLTKESESPYYRLAGPKPQPLKYSTSMEDKIRKFADELKSADRDASSLKERISLSAELYDVKKDGDSVSASIKATMSNISDRQIRALWDFCPACFWTVSVNGESFVPLSSGKNHAGPCIPVNVITLNPKQSFTLLFTGENGLNGKGIKTMKLRFSGIESSQIAVP
ncbi:MAG: hypothetical protein RDV48_24795 [Candidatus Eremiobacteraeota bacterium]|nr:hypothetical protein [Candidatus Eremiobacteraeota bacterium]